MPVINSSPRTPTNISRPEPIGYCDRCGFRTYLRDMPWQWDWRGNALQNLRIRVCTQTCQDVPQEQLRPVIIGPDPVAIRDPRPGWAATQMEGTGPGPPLPLTVEQLFPDEG